MGQRPDVDEIHRAYSVLGVPPTASPEEIRQCYLRLSQQWHPDKWMSDPVGQWRATEKMKRLNEAYALVKDAPLLADRAARTGGVDARSSSDASEVLVVTSRTLTSNLVIAGWLGTGLGLYAFGDSLLALFGVSLIRESGALLEDIRSISRHTPSGAAFGS
jgi:curved DNA-binding protein CbpA